LLLNDNTFSSSLKIKNLYTSFDERIENITVKDRSDLKVVLTDDSPLIRKLLLDALTRAGFTQLRFFNDGKQAWDFFENLVEVKGDKFKEDVDILITDIEMPQMDGYRFASTIKNDDRFKEVPIVFNSSLSNEFSEIKSKEAGGAAYLTKFDAGVFYQEVLKVIEAHSKSAK